MLIIFKSPASGAVIMLGENGKDMLNLLGKEPDDAKGIVTVEQLPSAIGTLMTAIEADKARQLAQSDSKKDSEATIGDGVHLFQRALPLLELLESSLKDEVPVTWGV